MSEGVSKSKERVLQRLEDRKRMLSTFIICTAAAIVSVLLLILIRINVLDLYGTLGSVSHLLPGLIRVVILLIFFTTLIVGIANIREYYIFKLSGWFDVIAILIITLLLAYFLFDFPTGIADTLATLGGCTLLVVYFYLIQD
ncbi:MAG: hypothetical protein HWN65_05615 [Candidatus Helarchaeota archaeon]|nr:hypothetical protein [Candidatus Helarchaeota archaeon]